MKEFLRGTSDLGEAILEFERLLARGARFVILTALIADNLFGRFPRLEVLTVEYGSSWVGSLRTKLDHIARLHSLDLWLFGPPPARPSETFRRNIWVTPFFEDNVAGSSSDSGRTTCSPARTTRIPRNSPGRRSSPTRSRRSRRTASASSRARISRAWSEPENLSLGPRCA